MNMGYVLLVMIGGCAGAIVSAGVVALITSTGVVTRMAGKTHTGHFILGYETAIIFGVILWNVFWVFGIDFHLPDNLSYIFQVIMGISQGIFVGALAVSLAEVLNGTAIFARRIKLSKGVGFVILFTALGKVMFSIIQFLYK